MSINIIEKLRWYIVAIFYAFLWLFSTAHDFNLWSQVTYLQGSTPVFSSIYTSAHFLRYLLVYPIFVAAETFSLDANEIFNVLCYVMLFYISKNCGDIFQYYCKYNALVSAIFFTFIFVTVSVFMNGRLLFSFLGFSYLIATIHRWELHRLGNLRHFINILIALFLCSVSTGTFLLCIISLTVWSTVTIHRRKKAFYSYIVLSMIVLNPLVSLYILKNVNFYGGGVSGLINMLNHGAGVVFYSLSLDLLILICLIFILCFCFAVALYWYAKNYRLLLIFLASTLFSGLFGFSTLTLGIIPASILSFVVLNKVMPSKLLALRGFMCILGKTG